MWSSRRFLVCRSLCLLIAHRASFAGLVLHLALRGGPGTCPCVSGQRPEGGGRGGGSASKLQPFLDTEGMW